MNFGEKLKDLRESQGLTQQNISEKLGVTKRAYAYYEANQRYPNQGMLVKLANTFRVSIDYLLTNEETFIQEVADRYGYNAKYKAEQLVTAENGLFAGGELDDEDKEAFFKAITEIYFESKERSKKFAPKKYQKRKAKD